MNLDHKPLFKIGDLVTINLDPDKHYPAGQNKYMRSLNGLRFRVKSTIYFNAYNYQSNEFIYDKYVY